LATVRYGFSGAVNNITPSTPQKSTTSTSQIISSRVRDIILDNTHPRFQEFGEWNGVGTIFIESAKNPVFSPQIPLISATPIFPNIKHYPLVNEIVPIVYLTNTDVTENTTSVSAYYLPPINIWNSQIHNAIPSSNLLPPSQEKDYTQVEAGSVRRITDQSTEINLGKTFNENNTINIHPLLPYEGDIIYEGRFGNSIRLGSTVSSAPIINNWSSAGSNGSPITIIRNGQPDSPLGVNETSDSWVPILENINRDKSSVYLTSNQRIPLLLSSGLRNSFSKSTPPTSVGQYENSQIILNSGRLVFSAINDSIILDANKSIILSSNTHVNIESKNQIVLQSAQVYLGSSSGIDGVDLQSLVKGENLNTVLSEIAAFLKILSVAFRTATDITGTPIASLNAIAADADTLGNNLSNSVKSKDLLSKIVKTK